MAICGHCEAALTKVLAETPWLAGQLGIVEARQSVYGSRDGGKRTKGTEQPLPYHIAAADASANLKAMLVSWAKMLIDEGATPEPRDTTADLSAWLLARMPLLRVHEAGPDAVEELCAAYRDGVYAVDRPADRLYLGTCGAEVEGPVEQACKAALWGREGRTEVICDDCGAVWDQAQRARQVAAAIDEDMRDRLVTASEAATIIAARAVRAGVDDLDVARLTDRIRKWATPSDGRAAKLLTMGQARMAAGGPDRGLYRYGDVVALLERRQRHAERRLGA